MQRTMGHTRRDIAATERRDALRGIRWWLDCFNRRRRIKVIDKADQRLVQIGDRGVVRDKEANVLGWDQRQHGVEMGAAARVPGNRLAILRRDHKAIAYAVDARIVGELFLLHGRTGCWL